MATGVKRKPTKGGLFQAYFTDYTGKKRYFTTLTRSEAKREAKRLEAEHRLIRQGIRPVPSSAGRHRSTLYKEVVEEYLVSIFKFTFFVEDSICYLLPNSFLK